MGKGRFYASIGLAVAITLFFILPSMAATIKGIAYDTELRPLKDVIIEINTTRARRQRFFSAGDNTGVSRENLRRRAGKLLLAD